MRSLFLLAVMVSWALPGHARVTGASASYTVSRTARGVQISLRTAQREYAAHGLVAVTVTLRNLARPHMAVSRSRPPYGVCSWPAVTLTSIDAAGTDAEPTPPIRPPAFPCPGPLPVDLPRGRSIVEQQIVEVWSSRLRATAQPFAHVNGGYSGFAVLGPTATFRLHPVPAPTIHISTVEGTRVAALNPAPPAGTPVYYRSWGTCSNGQMLPTVEYWRLLSGASLSSGCAQPKQWHVDMGPLNGPVATLNLGASRSP
jgi:hypothetical protein